MYCTIKYSCLTAVIAEDYGFKVELVIVRFQLIDWSIHTITEYIRKFRVVPSRDKYSDFNYAKFNH